MRFLWLFHITKAEKHYQGKLRGPSLLLAINHIAVFDGIVLSGYYYFILI